MDMEIDETREEVYTFSKIFTVDKIKLIEVEPSFLENVEAGALEIRGNPNEEAHLVTKTGTYKMRTAETSNSWLIVDEYLEKHNLEKKQIIGAVTQYYLLEKAIPQVQKIKSMLMEVQYDGEDSAEADELPVGYSLADFQEYVQASDAEILKYLDRIDAIEIKNRWRLLSKRLYTAVLEDVLISIEELGLSVDSVSLDEILTKTTDYPKDIVRCVIKMFSERGDDSKDVFKLSEKKICLFRVDQAVNECKDKALGKELVIKMVESTIPDEMKMNEDYLNGKYISKNEFGKEVLEPFDETQLSVEAKTRFAQLFDFKDTWRKEELEVYLKTLLEAGDNFDKLLLKHTRAYTEKVGREFIRVFRERGTRAKKKKSSKK